MFKSNKVRALESEVALHKERYDNLNAELEAAVDSITELRKEVVRLTKELTRQTELVNECDSTIEDLREDLHKQTRECEIVANNFNALDASYEKLQQRYAALEKRMETISQLADEVSFRATVIRQEAAAEDTE
jgi:chromosome segregation ATPase